VWRGRDTADIDSECEYNNRFYGNGVVQQYDGACGTFVRDGGLGCTGVDVCVHLEDVDARLKKSKLGSILHLLLFVPILLL
jgi:hypothetical protein